MRKLFDAIISKDLTPNQYYVLENIKNKYPTKNVFIALELRLLYLNDFVTKDYELTEKSIKVIEEINNIFANPKSEYTEDFIDTYLSLWPSITLPSGKPAKVAKGNLKTTFAWFFKNYPEYEQDTILKATRLYLNHQEQNNYKFCRTSKYFIKKQDVIKDINSDLADYCNRIITNDVIDDNESLPFTDNVV